MFEQYPLAYCMNVHPHQSLDEVFSNLEDRAAIVAEQVQPGSGSELMGVGLWFPAEVCFEFQSQSNLQRLRSICESKNLLPFTFNGFPYGNFHQPVVKHDVYKPTWAERERLDYTIQLVDIQNQILPEGLMGTISTLPLGWPTPDGDDSFRDRCAKNLAKCAEYLASLEEKTGRWISICLEPEPGCELGNCRSMIEFFQEHLLNGAAAEQQRNRRYLNVCYDVCHSAVNFEPQTNTIQQIAEAGIEIGKVQISSAIECRFSDMDTTTASLAMQQLSDFAEDRYLHQTCKFDAFADEYRFFEDLPAALAEKSPPETEIWRIHFHVPVFLGAFGNLHTTHHEIAEAFHAVRKFSKVRHFEIETYAWGVLPNRDSLETLEVGIAHEMNWFNDTINSV